MHDKNTTIAGGGGCRAGPQRRNGRNEHNSGEDWYTPVGSGSVLLIGLAGAYLLGKRKKDE